MAYVHIVRISLIKDVTKFLTGYKFGSDSEVGTQMDEIQDLSRY